MLVAREYTQPVKLDNFSTNQTIALAIDTIFSWPIPSALRFMSPLPKGILSFSTGD